MQKNKLIRNYHYLSDANYIVIINYMLLGFSKVKNIAMQQDRDHIEQGGSEIPLSVEAAGSKMQTLILEKAAAWDMESILARTLVPGCEIGGMDLLVMTEDRQIRKAFFIENGIVIKRSYSDLDAASGEILKLTLEILHTGLEEL